MLQYWGHRLPAQEEDLILYNRLAEYLFCTRLPAFEDTKINKTWALHSQLERGERAVSPKDVLFFQAFVVSTLPLVAIKAVSATSFFFFFFFFFLNESCYFFFFKSVKFSNLLRNQLLSLSIIVCLWVS